MTRVLARSMLIGGILCFVLGLFLGQYLVEGLSAMARALDLRVEAYPLISALIFSAAFVAVVTIGLPGGAVFAVLAGYFFGYIGGVTITLLSITLSAVIVWFVVGHSGMRFFPGVFPTTRAEIRQYIQSTEYFAPFILRLIPVFPFYLVNLALAGTGISFRAYVLTAAVGSIPSVAAFVVIGQSAQGLLVTESISLVTLLKDPWFYTAVVVLVLLSTIAVVFKPSALNRSSKGQTP